MSFIREAIEASKDVWEECVGTRFVREMASGELPLEKFKGYIVQDSIYLKQYARVYAMAMYKSQTLEDMRLFYEILAFVTEGESSIRLNYLKQFGMTDDDVERISAHPTNKAYTDFMLDIANRYDVPEILAAVLPCMMGYCFVMTEIAKRDKAVAQSRYLDLIRDYANEDYVAACRVWGEFTDRKCENLPEERKAAFKQIFRQASLHELYFWEMAYGEDDR